MKSSRVLKLFVLITVALMVLIAAGLTVYAESTEGTLTETISWTLDDSGVLTITGTGAMPDYQNSSNSPFYNNGSIKSISIGDGITAVGDRSFVTLNNLESLSLPEGLLTIGKYAFTECRLLTSVSFPDSLTAIKQGAFSDCAGFKAVVIPDKVTEVGADAFRSCYNIKTLNLSKSLKSIGEEAFGWCYKLRSLELPDEVEILGYESFGGCTDLKKVTIPASVRSMEGAFLECFGLDEVYFKGDAPENLEWAFYSCDLTAYYPMGNATWTEDVTGSGYGGKVKWASYCAAHQNAAAVKENVKDATVFKAGSYDNVVRCKICGEVISSTTVKTKKLTPTIKLSAKKKTIKKGKTYTLKATGLANGDSVKSYKSSKKNVASVTKKGKIKALKKGKTVITVKLASGKTAKCKITVS